MIADTFYLTEPKIISNSTNMARGRAAGANLRGYQILSLIDANPLQLTYFARSVDSEQQLVLIEFYPEPDLSSAARRAIAANTDNKSAVNIEEELAAFAQEASWLHQFKHPAFFRVINFWQEQNRAYAVLPFYQGTVLEQYLEQSPQICNEAWLLRTFTPILAGLAQIHAAGQFHLDISPKRILILKNNAPLLLHAKREADSQTVPVSMGYAPIERHEENTHSPVDGRSDLYAVAASMYHAIIGIAPVPSVVRAVRDNYKSLSQLKPKGYSPQVLNAIDQALSLFQESRPESIAAFARLLGVDISQTSPANIAPAHPSSDDDEFADDDSNATGAKPSETKRRSAAKPHAQAKHRPANAATQNRTPLFIGIAVALFVISGAWLLLSPKKPPEITYTSAQTPPIAPAPTIAPTPPSAVAPLAPVVTAEPQPALAPTANPAQPVQTAQPVQQAVTPATPAPATPASGDAAAIAAKKAEGLVVFNIKPWGEIFVGGRGKGTTPPLKRIKLEEGKHRIEVRNAGAGAPYAVTLEIKGGSSHTVTHDFQKGSM